MSGSNDSVKKQLEAERDQLLVGVGRLNNSHDEHFGIGNHPADDATEVFEQAKNSALSHNLEGLLWQVEDALCRIDQGVYGLCKRCGDEIDVARLEALPSATHCIECQRHIEKAARWRSRRAA
jgi:DnaK suppressor protein